MFVRRCSRIEATLRLMSVSFPGATAGRNPVKERLRTLS